MSNNDIAFLCQDAFTNAKSLEDIGLSNNSLQYVLRNTQLESTAVENLRLEGNYKSAGTETNLKIGTIVNIHSLI